MAKKLYKGTSHIMIDGVCKGMAERLGVDALIIRLVWVLLTLCTLGSAMIVYMILAILLPTKNEVVRRNIPKKES